MLYNPDADAAIFAGTQHLYRHPTEPWEHEGLPKMTPEERNHFLDTAVLRYITGHDPGKGSRIMAFTTSGAIAQPDTQVISPWADKLYYDNYWMRSFMPVTLIDEREWEIHNVRNPVEMTELGEGGQTRTQRVTSDKERFELANYAVELGFTRDMLTGNRLSQFVTSIEQLRTAYQRSLASSHYAVLAAAAVASSQAEIAYQGAATQSTVVRDIATINSGLGAIETSLQDVDPEHVMMGRYIIYVRGIQLKGRMVAAVQATTERLTLEREVGASSQTVQRTLEVIETLNTSVPAPQTRRSWCWRAVTSSPPTVARVATRRWIRSRRTCAECCGALGRALPRTRGRYGDWLPRRPDERDHQRRRGDLEAAGPAPAFSCPRRDTVAPMAWPPTVSSLRLEITTRRSDDSLHRILQAAVDVTATYGLTDAISENMAMQLAVVDVQFDALRVSGGGGAGQVIKDHRAARNGVLQEMSRLRRRAGRGLDSSDAPSVPETAAAPTANAPVSYLTFAEWERRTHSTTMPVKADGTVNQERVETLLDDAAAWCASIIPGNLIRGGVLIPEGDLPAALVAVCKQVSTQLIDQWLSPRNEKYVEDCAACEDRAAMRLRDTAQAAGGEGSAGGEVPETPVTPPTPTVTRYLLVSTDATFTALEVVVTDTSGDTDLQVPSDAIPAGETRFLAYARPASLGDYVSVYYYPDGHANTRDVLAGYNIGPDIDIAGVSCRLLRSKGAYRDTANDRIMDAR